MKRLLEGSQAVAEAVMLCRPQVVAAYPITPQTHIIEQLAQHVSNGELEAEFINAESEFGAASIVLGAVAAGARSFTATASQGLLLMTEVLYNIAGLRLPVVMLCANRAVGAPINIFSDHQDSMSVRDAGWIQLYVESNQEAVDTLIQAYRIAEACGLPVMVCMDGFLLTHTFEPVELPTQVMVDNYLPPFFFSRRLDPARPMTLGGASEADNYQEYRRAQQGAMEDALPVVEAFDAEFDDQFGRAHGGLIQTYRFDDAETVLLGMGSLMGAVHDVVDKLRDQGQAIGALRLRCFRPFPAQALAQQLRGVQRIVVLEKAISIGAGGIIAAELRAVLHQAGNMTPVESVIAGLGGRDLTADVIEKVLQEMNQDELGAIFRFAPDHVTGNGEVHHG
ncbi:MAG TPA: pyruvate ferredoxin oxidoreductase [Candidatus Tenderia electrophaga]|uniref:Pyruvate ferredoxin oxidoreductase n=1 Tax=Candidatus Tenderia electrophaga TaxID=1748243 RepID=A0A832J4P9_9GAMM|nr:pyruvate ferredoxin oxidoreductase [Candidatus Tenderia electrophaga]